jgi:hypothetical protein
MWHTILSPTCNGWFANTACSLTVESICDAQAKRAELSSSGWPEIKQHYPRSQPEDGRAVRSGVQSGSRMTLCNLQIALKCMPRLPPAATIGEIHSSAVRYLTADNSRPFQLLYMGLAFSCPAEALEGPTVFPFALAGDLRGSDVAVEVQLALFNSNFNKDIRKLLVRQTRLLG